MSAKNITTESTTSADQGPALTPEQINANILAEALVARKENFKRLFNPKMAVILAKRDEVKRMADNPASFEGVLGMKDVVKAENLLGQAVADIVKAMTELAEYVAPTDAAPRALREKPSFNLFDE